MPYLSERALDGLKHYQYKPGGYTWLDDLHQPFWNWFTYKLPVWLAPNLITLTGLVSLVVAYFLDCVEMPNLIGKGPWWMYATSGAAMIFYTNMDCIDGKQARRTGSSSPLGQMFDHGVDALAVHLVMLNFICTLGLGHSWMTPALLVAVKIPWLLAQWEEYHTGLMLYGNGWWGVLEINYGVALAHFITAAAGPEVWRGRPFAGAVVGGYDVTDMDFRHIIVVGVLVGSTMQSGEQLYRVFSGTHPCPQKERGNKELSLFGRVVQIAEKVALGSTAVVWLYLSPSASARNVLSTFGIVYAWEATQLIVAHMTKEPIITTWWPTVTMGMAACNAYLGLLDPSLVAFAVNGFVIVGYLHYVVCVVNEICAELGINCLTIKHKKDS